MISEPYVGGQRFRRIDSVGLNFLYPIKNLTTSEVGCAACCYKVSACRILSFYPAGYGGKCKMSRLELHSNKSSGTDIAVVYVDAQLVRPSSASFSALLAQGTGQSELFLWSLLGFIRTGKSHHFQKCEFIVFGVSVHSDFNCSSIKYSQEFTV